MCIVCKDWELGKLTTKEALGAIGELMSAAKGKEMKHLSEAYEKVMEKEVPFKDTDSELDSAWHEETHE